MSSFLLPLPLLFLLLSLLPLLTLSSTPLTETEYAAHFADWMTNHHRAYTSTSLPVKFATFKANHQYVTAHNQRAALGQHSYALALNQHADLSHDEYRQLLRYTSVTTNATGGRFGPTRHGMSLMQHYRHSSTGAAAPAGGCTPSSSTASPPPTPPAGVTSAAPHARSSTAGPGPSPARPSSTGAAPAGGGSTGAPAPSNGGVDWRGSGLVGPVKDQGQCGSCWAFASVASMEGAWAQSSGSLLSFSEQQLIDCAANGQDTCDRGGDMADSWTYLLTSPKPHPELESAYAYTGLSSGQCRYSASSAQSQVSFSSSVNVAKGSESALLTASAARPAVAVAIDASAQSFQFYSSGVYSDSSCSSTQLDHAVTVVGYGTSGTSDYWIVKNSWGTSWGMQGYFYLARNAGNMCGVASDASYILA